MSAAMGTGRRDPSDRELRVEAGRVVCPLRGPVDIADCWICPRYRGLSGGHVEALICGITADALATAVWAVDHDDCEH